MERFKIIRHVIEHIDVDAETKEEAIEKARKELDFTLNNYDIIGESVFIEGTSKITPARRRIAETEDTENFQLNAPESFEEELKSLYEDTIANGVAVEGGEVYVNILNREEVNISLSKHLDFYNTATKCTEFYSGTHALPFLVVEKLESGGLKVKARKHNMEQTLPIRIMYV